MKRDSLNNRKNIWSLHFSSAEMPHGTIETNRDCNILCENCYNIIKEHIKPLAVIKSEVDTLLEKRKLQTLTLMGGEPTLHPDLPAIVAYVKSKNVYCQILTNGVAFLEPEGLALLDLLRSSGVDRLALHVDQGQRHVHTDIDKTRLSLFDLMESHNIHFALSITIDEGERAVIPQLIKLYAGYRFFDGIVGFMASGLDQSKNPGSNLEQEYQAILSGLDLDPTAFIPSSVDPEEIRWLLYYFMVDSRSGTTYGLPPLFSKIFSKTFHKLTGRFPFTLHLHPFFSAITSLLVLLSEPRKVWSRERAFWTIVERLRSLFSTRFQYIVFQVPPEFTDNRQNIEICLNCPDATIRNGKLVPLCLADFISQIDPDKEEEVHIETRFSTIVEYLN